MATQTKFRRVHGRVIPIRVNVEDKSDLSKAGVALSIAAGAAIAAGRLAPPGGLAAASPKMRKALSFHLARAFGATAILGGGYAATKVGHIAERHQKDSGGLVGGVAGGLFAAMLPKFARLGKAWRSAAAYRAATKGSKYIGTIKNHFGG
jgi:hypothetical protein